MKPLDVILKNLFKYSVHIVLAVMLIFAGKLAWDYKKQADLSKKQYENLIGISEKYKQLSDYTAVLETNYASEKDILKQAQTSWAAEKKDLQGQVRALASATFSIKNFPREQGAPDLVDETSMTQEVQFVDKDGNLGPAVGVVKIENKTGKTTSKLYDSEFKIDSLITKEKNGHVHILAKAWYIQREASLDGSVGKPDWKDRPFPLPITGGSLTIDPTEPIVTDLVNKFRFAPHLNVGGFAGFSTQPIFGGRVGISFWGYGLTKNDLDYKLGELGVNYSKDYIDLSVVPIQWRIGNVLPLVDDMYISAGAGITPTTRSVFLDLSTTF